MQNEARTPLIDIHGEGSPGANFINVLHAHFSHESVLRRFSLVTI